MDHPEDEGHALGDHDGKQDVKEVVARLEEFKKSMEAKIALRQSNLSPERPDIGFLRSLDSSIKRNTAVIKKLKQITEEQREGMMDDLRSVNLSKFVSEAVAAICDAKLKTSDIQAAVQICSLLHQRYNDFSPSLIQGLLKIFLPGKSGDDYEADRSLKAMKKRSTLKLLLELYFVGVIEDASVFVNIIKDLTSVEQFKDRDTTQTNLSLLASFARQGRFFFGLPQSGPEIQDEFFNGLNVMADQKKIFRKAFYTYYDATAELLQSEHTALRQMEHENAKTLNAKGELSDENTTSYEKLRKSYDQLFRGVATLAEALDMQPPVMPEDGHTTRVTTGEDASSPVTGKESSALEPLWDDEDTRAFYECLPDLRAFVPAVLLGELEPKVSEQSSKTQLQSAESASEPDQGHSIVQDVAHRCVDSEALQEGKADEIEKCKEENDKEKPKDAEKEKGKEKDVERKGESEKEKLKSLEGSNLEAMIHRLPGCVSRDLIDQLTVEFCYLNSKSNRKRLVRALFNVPRTSLELLPYYSRMVATLSTCMKDVSSMLMQSLEDEFNYLISKKDQMNIESKIRNIRFIGELCKFKIAPAGLVFSCLKACLDDFSHHNIDVACNLLETCGRFLYRSPETTIRMTNMLEILMRLKNVKNLDPHHSTLVENAYYMCKPPERSARISKVRPPLHQYIRKLLFSDLDKSSIERVLRQLRKLPWSECETYLLKCFMKVHKGKYSQVHMIASLTASLGHYHDEFAIAVVDEVLEEIRLGLELNEYGMQQRRITYMRFLGELYNYQHIDSSVIFETLYLILVFGHGTPEQDALDPPEDYFRIRMVITLLQTCGHYFDRGSSKRKLDRFLIYFQRYILSKGSMPLDIEFDLQDLFADLRPKMRRYMSIDEVNSALVEVEEHEGITLTGKANGRVPTNAIEENGKGHDHAVGDIESDSGSGSVNPGQEGEQELYEDKSEECGSDICDDDGGEAHDPDEENEVKVRQRVVPIDPEEEADFERELRALTQESFESRKLELRTRPTLNMTLPMNVLDHHSRSGVEEELGDEALDEDGSGGNKEVSFKVLVKRGNKQQTKQMLVPRDCKLVRNTKQNEAAESEEKRDINNFIKDYINREEEDLNGIGAPMTNWIQTGISSVTGRGNTWGGSTGGRGGGVRYRNPVHISGGGGLYYGRRK